MNTKAVLAIIAALACLATAPATRADKTHSIDGSVILSCGTPTLLFGGAVPPNGFMVQVVRNELVVNDNGPAGWDPPQGIHVLNGAPPFVTPPGYTPIGPVSAFAICGVPPTTAYVFARAW
jgi:hypothetical protein